mmetsp:Transcript_12656/g.24650  ORF Transcript_12656/g.24650 Transcript_12656/m.24650 type:complete len:247 (+) Transcript_12656:203-943(+)
MMASFPVLSIFILLALVVCASSAKSSQRNLKAQIEPADSSKKRAALLQSEFETAITKHKEGDASTERVGGIENDKSPLVVKNNDGPSLGDAWLTEVNNQPNFDIVRLLGWDVYAARTDNGTLPKAAHQCTEAAQLAVYSTGGETEALDIMNCFKKAGDDHSLIGSCLCKSPVSKNMWVGSQCCTPEVLQFDQGPAKVNGIRKGVVDLAEMCKLSCQENSGLRSGGGLTALSVLLPLAASVCVLAGR